MLQDGFWHSSNALGQVVKAAVGGVVLNHRHASFGTVPLGRVNLDEAVDGRVAIGLVLA